MELVKLPAVTPENSPMAVLRVPVVFKARALSPMAVLEPPSVLLLSALRPNALLPPPVVIARGVCIGHRRRLASV